MPENIVNSGGSQSTMMQLGDEDGFQFSVDTAAYKTLRRKTEYTWPAQSRIGNSPALQSTGQGKDIITLNGEIYPHYKGGVEQIPKLRTMGEKGEPFLLQDAKGVSWGKWCIISVQEVQSIFLPGGLPRKVMFSLSLSRY